MEVRDGLVIAHLGVEIAVGQEGEGSPRSGMGVVDE